MEIGKKNAIVRAMPPIKPFKEKPSMYLPDLIVVIARIVEAMESEGRVFDLKYTEDRVRSKSGVLEEDIALRIARAIARPI